ncbi:hypothetical protein DPMN_052828 [Dreissena polymorpha]|uniref:Uncharacterized protein n=1 Tax=Dreissena polymorpha TaxID=45954 RepID=A0A9D4CKD0_DREPO|nr:hypothetical protein DPMN_052511 [Dreissena polymorpha]KAH3726949.1 hypothetical protein DPMN_052828 [Dreissena polymorpha]
MSDIAITLIGAIILLVIFVFCKKGSRTENPSQPNGCHSINVRIELVLDGHAALQRVHRNHDEGSSQHCTGCGCRVWTRFEDHRHAIENHVIPIRLSTTVERIEDNQAD